MLWRDSHRWRVGTRPSSLLCWSEQIHACFLGRVWWQNTHWFAWVVEFDSWHVHSHLFQSQSQKQSQLLEADSLHTRCFPMEEENQVLSSDSRAYIGPGKVQGLSYATSLWPVWCGSTSSLVARDRKKSALKVRVRKKKIKNVQEFKLEKKRKKKFAKLKLKKKRQKKVCKVRVRQKRQKKSLQS